MTVQYGKFELPERINKKGEKGEDTLLFEAEPFERGYGHTIGNALRRILLTSLEAPAIISVRIEDVPHEYTAVDGIVEDMTHIVLRLKEAKLRKIPLGEDSHFRSQKSYTTQLEITPQDLEQGGGQHHVTLKDLFKDSDYELVNPELVIFTVTKPMNKRIDFRIAIGRGYVPSERQKIEDKKVGEIVIDAPFSPVTLVNYFVEKTRVGQDTDYDKLILEIQTDGRVTGEEALSFATQIGMRHFEVFMQPNFHTVNFEAKGEEPEGDKDTLLSKLGLRINEIELSVRSTNCLVGADIETIAELVLMSEMEMLKFRNFGRKSLNEIKAKLEEMGLKLEMDLNKYGITRENVKEMMRTQQHENTNEESE